MRVEIWDAPRARARVRGGRRRTLWAGRALALALALTTGWAAGGGGAAAATTSACYAFSQDRAAQPRPARYAADLERGEVGITFVGHATFLIETAKGVSAATDYAGFAGMGADGAPVIPTLVTMNGAHSTHYTLSPDPRIAHVLRGWSDDLTTPAAHDLTVEDLRVRNVTTDVVRLGNVGEDQNSIFVFEIDGLCIGHLGHLHHAPTPEQLAKIGFLDVVMAPVDGVYTVTIAEMVAILQTLRAQVVIPMHAFGPSGLAAFVEGMRAEFEIATAEGSTVVVSKARLPRKPTVLVVPPIGARSPGGPADDF